MVPCSLCCYREIYYAEVFKEKRLGEPYRLGQVVFLKKIKKYISERLTVKQQIPRATVVL